MNAILGIFQLVLTLFELILLVRVLLSWFPNVDLTNPVIQLLFDITEPVLQPVRKMLPPSSTVDFSPLVVWLIIRVIRIFLGL